MSLNLVVRVQAAEPAATIELYNTVLGFHYFARSHLQGQEEYVMDILHDAFLIILDAITRHCVRSPEALIGFVRTVVCRRIYRQIRFTRRSRKQNGALVEYISAKTPNPHGLLVLKELDETVRWAAQRLTEKDREMFECSIIDEETRKETMRLRHMTSTQYRLKKNRVKVKVIDLARRKLVTRCLTPQLANNTTL